ncbi:ABC transporter permease [Paenibacillus albiflavus]|uniref:ABC transporter permease n=1 Tax=Paenibacillus albiflavus TaxID=2545760 RepID=A0A4R4E1K8_9BACL|nr:FtsX-like permease family protein [Paenibacillus albiflavus]TCZ73239.1 ABC transporter permease [Paenibacillus albiflavus]
MGIFWKMGARNFIAQIRQTLLTVGIGSIGVILIFSCYFVISSITYSKSLWEEKHFGVIGSEIYSRVGLDLTEAQIENVKTMLQTRNIACLPYVSQLVSVHSGNNDEAREDSIVALGFDFQNARELEPNQPLWSTAPLTAEEAIVSVPLARRLGLSVGETMVISFAGQEVPLTIRDLAEESGLTGFRGTMRAQGTVIFSNTLAHQIFGVPEASTHSILLATDKMYSSLPGSSFFTDLTERAIKREALSHMSMVQSIFTPPFLFFVAVSLFAGILLLAQLFNILKERRKYYLGVLRSLGLSNRICFVIYVSECTLLCAVITISGVVLGNVLGFGLLSVNVFYIEQLLERYSAYAYPIQPHVDVTATSWIALTMFIVFLLLACFVGRFIKRTSILHLMGKEDNRVNPGQKRLLKILGCLLVTVAFIYFNYFATEGLSDGDRLDAKVFGSIISWLVGIITTAYLMFLIVPWMKRASSIVPHRWLDRLAVTLGTQYPNMRFSRSFGIVLLFTVLSCCLIVMISFASNVEDYAAVNKRDSFMAADAYMAYVDEMEKDKLTVHMNEVQELIQSAAYVDTYRILVSSPDNAVDLTEETSPTNGNKWAYSQVVWGKWLGEGYQLPLTSRAPQFQSDAEVFQAMGDKASVVLVDDQLEGTYRVGDQIPLRLLKGGGKEENLIGEEVVTVAGTFTIGEDNRFQRGSVFIVADELYNKYSTNGAYKWPGEPKGYALLQLTDTDVTAVDSIKTLKYHFTKTAGVTVSTPGEDQAIITMIVKAEFTLFSYIMSFMMLMALLGMYVIQIRSVQERVPHMVMLWQMGVSQKSLKQVFIVEGCLIGIVGLISGIVVGRLGSEMLMRLAWMGVKFSFPYLNVIGLIIGLLIFIWLFNRFSTDGLRRMQISRTE